MGDTSFGAVVCDGGLGVRQNLTPPVVGNGRRVRDHRDGLWRRGALSSAVGGLFFRLLRM